MVSSCFSFSFAILNFGMKRTQKIVQPPKLGRPRNDPQPWNNPQIDPEMIPIARLVDPEIKEWPLNMGLWIAFLLPRYVSGRLKLSFALFDTPEFAWGGLSTFPKVTLRKTTQKKN